MRRIEKIIQYLDAGPALLHEIRDHIGGSVREDDIVATLRLGIRRGVIERSHLNGEIAYRLAADEEEPTSAAPAAPAVGGQGNNTDSDGRAFPSFGRGDVAAHETPAPADIAGSGTPDAGAGESVRATHVLKVIDEIRAALPGGYGVAIDDLLNLVRWLHDRWQKAGAHADDMSRSSAYAWLAGALGISEANCHIGMMDVDGCNAVVAACKARSGGGR